MTTLDTIHYRTFGRTDLRVSCLGFGGSPIGMLDAGDAAGDVLHTLLDAGVNVIDTAACYFGSEDMIGRAVGHRRDEYVIISKCGHAVPGERSDHDFTPEAIRRNIDTSLERLRTDHVDVMLLHSCDLATLQAGDAMAAVLEARDAGKVRFAGYSGDNDAAAWAAAHDDVDVIQTSVSICDQVNIDRMLPEAAKHRTGIMAKRPVANGAWKTLDEQYERYHNYARPYHDRFAQLGLSLEMLGADDWAEAFLRFTLSIEGVHTAIVGTTRRESAVANIEAAAKGPLPADAVQAIRAAYHRADPDHAWEGLT